MTNPSQEIIATRIESSIQSIKAYVSEGDTVDALISTLEALKADSSDELLLEQFTDTFNKLGITQGAVLTYAPYISVFLSDDLFGED